MTLQVHVVISGRVQGVWYRASTKQKAEELGLTGWVKNTKEGNVEAVFEGQEPVIDEMIAWCRKGPPLAHVSDVRIVEKRKANQYTDFTIQRS
jgi:acylphosphatase